MTVPANAVPGAEASARRAAGRAGVSVQTVNDLAGEVAVSSLFDRVWSTDGPPVLPANLVRAMAHSGNYLAGAWVGDTLAGAAFGFIGRDDDGLFLHSHMTGVDPTSPLSGVGFALKLHQRAWSLAAELERVEWTFDPLVRRNGYFNLVKLGAEIIGYHVNFYGDMPDGINAGDESDRVLVCWDLLSERVAQASDDGLAQPTLEALLESGAEVALDADADDRPVSSEVGAERLLCRVPEDIVALRRRDSTVAREWRHAVRDTFGAAVGGGYRATTITRDGWYLLEKGDIG